MAPTLCNSNVIPAFSSLRTVQKAVHAPPPTFFFSFRVTPSFAPINTIGFTSLRISHRAAATPKLRALKDDDVFQVEVSPNEESETSSTPPSSQDKYAANESLNEVTIDLKLPRRSLLVHFTCDACGERTQRLINRLAYERGTVFVQGVFSTTN
ncbi:uncharacterized protein LOC122078890 isoform X2 [Macadamia integrifolia]|uniref:uncharacterized protein LOC122078890 isoform X2 n=1 Tax=Macadamia integrifolia TaxID=60698 RepID=UPI001C4F0463|nr:uncharacterized protein LOC122078890 isoform X2 [Macadamia integrifolia]